MNSILLKCWRQLKGNIGPCLDMQKLACLMHLVLVKLLAPKWIKPEAIAISHRMSSVPELNPQLCRLCQKIGHRTSQCPEMSDPEDSFCEVALTA